MLLNAIVLALREIRRNVLRSSLTALGIIIGVASVIIMVTLGNGATAQVTVTAGQRSGFQLSFDLASRGLINRTLLPAGFFDPQVRALEEATRPASLVEQIEQAYRQDAGEPPAKNGK